MRKFILGVTITAAVLVLGGLGFATFGFFPTEANTAPPRLEQRVAQGALDASMKRHAPQLTSPLLPTDQNLIDGMKIYYVNCALCHGGLDRKPAALAKNFYPPVPNLISDPTDDPEWRIFFTVRTGVRYTGMPAWEGVLSEPDMWKLTSFLSHIDKLPPAAQDYWKNNITVASPAADEKKEDEKKEGHKH